MGKMKQLASMLGAVGLLSVSTAFAGPLTFDLNKPAVSGGALIAANVQDFDYNSAGASVVKGSGPFGATLSVGQTFEVLLQTNVVTFNDAAGQPITALAGLNQTFGSGGYEITAVARFTEQVVFVAGNSATLALIPGSGTVSLYYDDSSNGGAKSVLSTGVGYDDGLEIYRGLLDFGITGFLTVGSIGTGSANLQAQTILADLSVLDGLSGGLDFRINAEGQTAFPPGNADTNNYHTGGDGVLYPNYVVDNTCEAGPFSCDLKLRFDGSSRFVPEPDSLALAGLALVGLGAFTGAIRRRRVEQE